MIRIDFIFLFILALITLTSRLIPFVFESKLSFIQKFQKTQILLPTLFMLWLVYLGLKQTPLDPQGILKYACVLLVGFTHLWKNNFLLSILIPTLVYCFFLNIIFS